MTTNTAKTLHTPAQEVQTHTFKIVVPQNDDDFSEYVLVMSYSKSTTILLHFDNQRIYARTKYVQFEKYFVEAHTNYGNSDTPSLVVFEMSSDKTSDDAHLKIKSVHKITNKNLLRLITLARVSDNNNVHILNAYVQDKPFTIFEALQSEADNEPIYKNNTMTNTVLRNNTMTINTVSTLHTAYVSCLEGANGHRVCSLLLSSSAEEWTPRQIEEIKQQVCGYRNLAMTNKGLLVYSFSIVEQPLAGRENAMHVKIETQRVAIVPEVHEVLPKLYVDWKPLIVIADHEKNEAHDKPFHVIAVTTIGNQPFAIFQHMITVNCDSPNLRFFEVLFEIHKRTNDAVTIIECGFALSTIGEVVPDVQSITTSNYEDLSKTLRVQLENIVFPDALKFTLEHVPPPIFANHGALTPDEQRSAVQTWTRHMRERIESRLHVEPQWRALSHTELMARLFNKLNRLHSEPSFVAAADVANYAFMIAEVLRAQILAPIEYDAPVVTPTVREDLAALRRRGKEQIATLDNLINSMFLSEQQ